MNLNNESKSNDIECITNDIMISSLITVISSTNSDIIVKSMVNDHHHVLPKITFGKT